MQTNKQFIRAECIYAGEVSFYQLLAHNTSFHPQTLKKIERFVLKDDPDYWMFIIMDKDFNYETLRFGHSMYIYQGAAGVYMGTMQEYKLFCKFGVDFDCFDLN